MRRVMAVAAAALLLAACGGAEEVVSAMADTDPEGWRKPAEVTFDNCDTLALRDLALTLRYDARAAGDTLRLAITFTAPDSTIFFERLPVHLPRRRKGFSAAALALAEIPYRRGARFAQEGRYRISIFPSDGAVRGIEAAGIAIRRATDND